jgi:hypothetical protein
VEQRALRPAGFARALAGHVHDVCHMIHNVLNDVYGDVFGDVARAGVAALDVVLNRPSKFS